MQRTTRAIVSCLCALGSATLALAPLSARAGEDVQIVALDQGALRLADGRRLAPDGAVFPTRLDPSHLREAAAREAAQGLFQTAIVLPASPRRDRHGRLTGPARRVPIDGVQKADGEDDLAVALVRAGAAYADPAARIEAADALLAAEDAARRARRGIWALPDTLADSAQGAQGRVGLFTVAQGRVFSARTAGSTLYINFSGPKTVALAASTGAKSRHGLVPATLAGTVLRVRGVVQGTERTRIALGARAAEMIAGPAKETEQ